MIVLNDSHQAEMCDSKAGAELLDIILMKVNWCCLFCLDVSQNDVAVFTQEVFETDSFDVWK